MDFLSLAKQRCSVRKYKKDAVEKEKLDKLLEAARVAPTAANMQSPRLLVVSSNEGLQKLSKEMQNLIDWVLVSEQMKENNNVIRNLTGEYKQIEPDCREGVKEKLERMKELCKEHHSLYEKQNELKGQKWKLEKTLER